jgi:N-acetylmuramoyl-L-alanine amidase
VEGRRLPFEWVRRRRRWAAIRTGLTLAAACLIGVGVASRPDADAGDSRLPVAALRAADIVLPSGPEPAGEVVRAGASAGRVDPAVFPLALGTVVVDPGHGGENRGTKAPFGLVEKELTLDIGRRLRDLLGARGYNVVMTRDEDVTLPLRRRTELANEARGDVFVSIHLNWIETRETRGVETYYLGPTHDPALERLAADENRDSGYRIADLRSILDQLYADARQNESAQLARSVHRSLLQALRQINPGLENRGVKSAPFVVLTTTDMPAILAEVSCLSNDEEAELLGDAAYRDRIAAALADGIDGYARLRARASQKGTHDES